MAHVLGLCRLALASLVFIAGFGCGQQQPQQNGATIMLLEHRYSHREGSSKQNGHKGMSRGHFELLQEHDRNRRGRFLADGGAGVDFLLGGSADPSSGGGLYFTQVSLGTPPKQYVVQVDTGSDVLWLNCVPCRGCPSRSQLRIPLTLYDPAASSTMKNVGCSDSRCKTGIIANEAQCDVNQCTYTFQYGDGSTTSGYYIEDVMQYTLVSGTNTVTNATSKVLFGCSTSQSGDLTTSAQAVDGIMGFGQLSLSVVNQLASERGFAQIFAHCLEGESQGGGILVLGNVTDSGVVYTPLVPNSTHYNVNLLSITVASNKLPIDAEQFSSADQSGVIFDSGTTLAYFPNSAYNTIVNAIQQSTSADRLAANRELGECYLVSGSIEDSFPKITLNFEGGSSMVLSPDNYLILLGKAVSAGRTLPMWCIGWQSSSSPNGPKDQTRLTILGDIVLKNKLVVYDIQNSRIGWRDFNCSSHVMLGGQPVAASHFDTSGAASTSLLGAALPVFAREVNKLVSDSSSLSVFFFISDSDSEVFVEGWFVENWVAGSSLLGPRHQLQYQHHLPQLWKSTARRARWYLKSSRLTFSFKSLSSRVLFTYFSTSFLCVQTARRPRSGLLCPFFAFQGPESSFRRRK